MQIRELDLISSLSIRGCCVDERYHLNISVPVFLLSYLVYHHPTNIPQGYLSAEVCLCQVLFKRGSGSPLTVKKKKKKALHLQSVILVVAFPTEDLCPPSLEDSLFYMFCVMSQFLCLLHTDSLFCIYLLKSGLLFLYSFIHFN